MSSVYRLEYHTSITLKYCKELAYWILPEGTAENMIVVWWCSFLWVNSAVQQKPQNKSYHQYHDYIQVAGTYQLSIACWTNSGFPHWLYTLALPKSSSIPKTSGATLAQFLQPMKKIRIFGFQYLSQPIN